MKELSRAIQELCARYAIDEIASCRVDLLTHPETLRRIHEYLPGAKTVIVMVKKIPDGRIAEAPGPRYQEASIETFNALCRACEEMVLCLSNFGIASVWPGLEETPHQKEIAVRAGLGSIGDARLFISSRFGVDVHLESLITSGDIEFPRSGGTHFRCDHCGLCIDACPVNAIGPTGVNRSRCLGYRRTEVQEHKGLTTRYCGLCMKICPQKQGE